MEKKECLRLAAEEDLGRIVEIYNAAVPTRLATADTTPVAIESRREWFHRHDPAARPIWVAEKNDIVAGWVSLESFFGRPAYHPTAEISIYVAPEFQGRGLGRRLLQEAIDATPRLAVRTLLGFIFSHNNRSIHLFKAFGFEEWGRLHNVTEMDGKEYSVSIYGRRANSLIKYNNIK
ncbi:MAG: N-acetyltransferase [Deltaproteobacteria bacterium]|nr:N-acetyltransferase [Deltaproteobacteria bacterium]